MTMTMMMSLCLCFSHPLFPLLQLLFDKCETATNSAECPSSASFDLDIKNFIHLHERDKKPFYTDNADVNDVVSPPLSLFTHSLTP